MILKRVVEQLKQQQWTAVVIELTIVVLGVFIGLQVNNWNDARRDRMREQAYLEGIVVDLDESIVSLNKSIALTRKRMILDELLIKAASDPDVVRADPGRFIYAITRGGYSFSPTIRGYTFEEIKSTGDLEILRDRQLVVDLMKFYATVQGDSQWEFFRTSNQSEYFKRSAGILTAQQLMLGPSNSETIPASDVEDAMRAYQRLLDRPAFIEWVPTILFFRDSDLASRSGWLAEARDLRARILAKSRIGKAKTTDPNVAKARAKKK